jgi:hypothetical protein
MSAVGATAALTGCGGGGGSAAPAPAPPSGPPGAPVTKSAKRGIAYNLETTLDLAALAPGVSWWYDWSDRRSPGTPADHKSTYGVDFVPMIWDEVFTDADIVNLLRADPSVKFLLVMNEPNLTDQANLSPSAAATVWPRYEAIAAATGVKIVGPAMNYGTLPGFSDPVVWLDAFYAAYRGAHGGRDPQIDRLAFHWYDYGLEGQLNRLRDQYHKPFWVTEFANWHNAAGPHIDTVAKQKAQMTEMVQICESRDDVERYAWFTGRMSPDPHFSSLLGANGQLTELGRHYVSLPFET